MRSIKFLHIFPPFDEIRTPPILLEGHHWYRYHGRCHEQKHFAKRMLHRPPFVGAIEERSAFILVDDLRNAAYPWLIKLCSLAEALYMARNIFSAACEIIFGVDERL
ncbi:hypothetical protein AVEN_89821-1 [Araneus ventricosus]|uniref:Uncharacterized protein n=1 Tax=Araneus ventricosus TaxID=182803 RepID=A0A4Y2JX00_ARAVE|nr:hypothetical protein AVEN_89821-1 [Araneus ventricosus]